MRRGRPSKENYGRVSGSIPRININRRSSSVDCINRGSYLPSNRRTSSAERFGTTGSAVKHSRPSPRTSAVNLFGFQRGSLLDRKGIVKDHRPLAEKNYQRDCVRSLIEFLEDNKFPFSITPANLMPPTKNNFEKIFQFLYQMWDPNYEVHKIEDEAPNLLKSIGYPYMMNKSSFLTINRMSWPTLLGALMWLKDLCKLSAFTTLNDYITGEDFPNDEGLSILQNYFLQSFQTGVDDAEKDEEVFTHLVMQRYDMDYIPEEVESQIQELKTQIEKETKEQKAHHVLADSCKKLDDDIENYEKFSEDMMVHIQQKACRMEDIKEEKSEKEHELRLLKETVAKKEDIYKEQGYDAQHAMNFYQITKTDLLEKLEEKKRCLSDEERFSWDLKTEVFQMKEKVAAFCRQFAISWEELQNTVESIKSTLINSSVPSVAKMGKNFKLVLPEFQMFPDCINDVNSALEKIKNYIEEQRANIQSIVITQKNNISELEMVMSDLNIQEQMALAQTVQKERESGIKAEENLRELELIKHEYETSEQQVQSISEERIKLTQSADDLKNSMEEIRCRKEMSLKELSEEKESAAILKQNVVNLLQELYQQLEDEKNEVERVMNSVMKKIAENPVRT